MQASVRTRTILDLDRTDRLHAKTRTSHPNHVFDRSLKPPPMRRSPLQTIYQIPGRSRSGRPGENSHRLITNLHHHFPRSDLNQDMSHRMLACIRTCRMVGRHAVPCVQGGRGGGSICRGVRRGPERRRPGWANQTNKKNLSGLSVGVASNRRCHVGEGRGPNAILSGREGLAVTSHLHPSVRGNVREDAWLSPLEAVGHALCHCIWRFLSHRPGTSQAFVPGEDPFAL